MLPVARSGPRERRAHRPVHRDQRRVRDRAVDGGHPGVLVGLRPGGHPGADPGRRLRHHDPGVAARPADLAPAGSAHPVDRRRRDQEPRTSATCAGSCWGSLKVSLLFEAVTAALLTRRFVVGYDVPLGDARLPGCLPRGLGVQQRRLRALFSDNLIGFADDPWICLPIAVAVILGGLGLPGAPRAAPRAAPPREWSLHTKLTVGMTAVAAGRRHRVHHGRRVGQPRDPRRARHRRHDCWPGSSTRPCPARPASTPRHGRDAADGTLLGTDVLMFIGGGSRRDRRRHQGDHVRGAVLRDHGRGARRARGQRVRPPDRPAGPAPGPHRGPALRGRRGRSPPRARWS